MTAIPFEIDDLIAPAETQRMLSWLVEKHFDAPSFDWSALSVEVHGGEPGRGFGCGGFFYAADGRWRAAVPNAIRDRDEEYRIFDGWMRATKQGFGSAWQSALVQIFDEGRHRRATIKLDFTSVDRWTSPAPEISQGDFLRPADLPTPLGSGMLRS